MRCRLVWLLIAVGGVSLLGGVGQAEESPPPALINAQADFASTLEYFEAHVRPVLVTHCYECHAASTEQRGGLVLDRAAGWRKGGDSGPAIVPGDPASSLVGRAIRYDDPHLQMPPDGKLALRDIEAIERWIAAGANDPRREEPELPRVDATASKHQAAQLHWAYQPLRAPKLPAADAQREAAEGQGHRGVQRPIDAWLHQSQRALGIATNARASRRTLIRRVTFDLHGLAPTIAETQAFINDRRVDAYERLVDRLLASPRYAEHMARRWLDVARYAESLTLRGFILPNAWRYRDYCIRSLANDLPFDEFLREQIAGDLMKASDVEQRQSRMIAATFLLLGNTNLEEQDKRQLEMDVVDEQLDTLGRAVMGQTLGCARCHDHKFDPISTRDYYALAGILRASDVLIHDNVSQWIEVPLPADDETETYFAKLEARLSELQSQIEAMEPSRAATAQSAASDTHDGPHANSKTIEALRKEKQTLAAQLQQRPRTMAWRPAANAQDLPIHVRGSVHQLGESVPRGFLQCVALNESGNRTATPNRLDLADWLTDPRHPLTSRVIVNRVWCWLMGEGIVRSVDNLGTTGELPTQPELLDWLASDFIHHDWSLKYLVREIVVSDAYCRSSNTTTNGQSVDPENHQWWRAERKPIVAEALRDTMLQLSGELTNSMYGSRIPTALPADYGYVHTEPCRSIYVPAFRNALPEIIEQFNGANPSVSQGQRGRGILPQQALWLLNDEWVDGRASAIARRWIQQAGHNVNDEDWIDHAVETILGREPLEGERVALRDYFAKSRQGNGSPDVEMLAAIVHSLLASIEFRMLD